MINKRMIAVAILSLLLVMGVEVRAQGGTNKEASAQTRKPRNRARLRKPSTPQDIPVLAAMEDKLSDRLTIKGEILSVSGNNFTVRDARGMDTVVYLLPGTAYKIETPSGAVKKGEAKMILRALIVEIDGLLNSSYQMKADVIRTTESALKAAQLLQPLMRP